MSADTLKVVYIYDRSQILFHKKSDDSINYHNLETKETKSLVKNSTKYPKVIDRINNILYLTKQNVIYIISSSGEIYGFSSPINIKFITETRNYIAISNNNIAYTCRKVNKSEKVEWIEIFYPKETVIKHLISHPEKDIFYIMLNTGWLLQFADYDNFMRTPVLHFHKKHINRIIVNRECDIVVMDPYYTHIYKIRDGLYVQQNSMRYPAINNLHPEYHTRMMLHDEVKTHPADFYKSYADVINKICCEDKDVYYIKEASVRTPYHKIYRSNKIDKVISVSMSKRVQLYYKEKDIYVIGYEKDVFNINKLNRCCYCDTKIDAWPRCKEKCRMLWKAANVSELTKYTILPIAELLSKYIFLNMSTKKIH
jgi:hypothetical protein